MKKAFTLMELIIVIAILGILASIISANFLNSLKKGRDAKRKGDLEQIQRALEIYYEDNKAYPVTSKVTFGSSLCHIDGCSTRNYMLKLPVDPTSGKSYEYLSATGVDYKLFACLENNQQKLPYISSGYTIATMTSCGPCQDSAGALVTNCIWGVSSSNISP